MKPKGLYGLVLSGGKSTRMGEDKGLISYYGLPQREYLYQLLDKVCERTFISLRSDQTEGLPSAYGVILDQDVYRGPFNGILSAHMRYPEVAWLVLACDLPLIHEAALQELIAHRNKEAVGTTLALKNDNPLPEPVCAIWEPHGLDTAMEYLANDANGTCARKFLIRNHAHLVFPEDESVLVNANSKEDYDTIVSKIKG
ncbi:MAG: NTP transferase domain-containing protein [Flavobacteriaceae bacterium]